jgi:hypothetical protein
MTTNKGLAHGRVTIAAAKRKILDASERELFIDVYRRRDGTLKVVADEAPRSIFAGHLDADFADNWAVESTAADAFGAVRHGS